MPAQVAAEDSTRSKAPDLMIISMLSSDWITALMLSSDWMKNIDVIRIWLEFSFSFGVII
jgi:hypothetical protein